VEANTGKIDRAVFSMVRAVRVAEQRCGKHISAAANQHTTIKEVVFSVAVTPRLYNEDLKQLESKIELSSGVGSCSTELREFSEIAVGIIIGKKRQEKN
jgi:hypothetical protein